MDSSVEEKTPLKSRKNVQSKLKSQETFVDSTVKRRVSDVLVSIHQCTQVWEVDNQASFNTANTLCNLYSQWNIIKDNELSEVNEMCKRRYYVKIAAVQEDLLQKLKDHREKLDKLIRKLMGFVDNLKAIYYLGLVSDDPNTDKSPLPIFSMWNAEKFYYHSKLILDMYVKEFLLKDSFYKRFFQYRVESDDEEATSVLNQCINVWLHQPYLGEECSTLLDSMLVEAGLK